MLGGLFGIPIVKWTQKFKYISIFIFVVIAVHASTFTSDVINSGVRVAAMKFMQYNLTFVGIMVPIAIGVLAVFCLFICTGLLNKKQRVEE